MMQWSSVVMRQLQTVVGKVPSSMHNAIRVVTVFSEHEEGQHHNHNLAHAQVGEPVPHLRRERLQETPQTCSLSSQPQPKCHAWNCQA